jgi:hypothetical protein
MIHFDNSPVHRQNWGKADPDDPAPASVFTANFFLFPRNKRELADLTFSLKTFKKDWEGSVRTIMAGGFAETFWQWYDPSKKLSRLLAALLRKAKNTNWPNYKNFF